MIKHFCDQCGTELLENNRPKPRTDGVTDYLRRMAATVDANPAAGPNGGTFSFQIMVGKDGIWDDGEFCIPCIMGFIGQAYGYEIRPKPLPSPPGMAV